MKDFVKNDATKTCSNNRS